ncbi:MAG: 2-amino-4-hydroxy-6-hydroxymethyldihydropteridine diphosphokinase [Acidobacteriota bacterium]
MVLFHGTRERRGIFLGLGSNMGNRAACLERGLKFLEKRGIIPIQSSRIYATQPVGPLRQREFLNQVVEVASARPTAALVATGLAAEAALGRVRRWPQGPRPLDVDLLLDGETILQNENVQVPHPRLHLRRFVLVPLADLAPALRHPVLGWSITELLRRCPDRSWIRPAGAFRRLEVDAEPIYDVLRSPQSTGHRRGRLDP